MDLSKIELFHQRDNIDRSKKMVKKNLERQYIVFFNEPLILNIW